MSDRPVHRRLPRPASLRSRVTLTVLALLAVLLVLLFTAVDLVLGARLHADLRTRLTDRVALARQLDGSLSSPELVNQLRGEGVTAQLCTYGQGCVTADPAPAPPEAPAAAPPDRTPGAAPAPPAPGRKAAAAIQRAGSTLYVRTLLADGQQLTLAVDDSDVSTALSRLVALEVVGGAVALLLAGLLLGRLVGAALHPLDRMTSLARDIAAGDRGRRLRGQPDVIPADTELGRTAAAFDAMLDELETALAAANAAETRMRAFLSDASHELRTPLAGLQATVENLLRTDPGRLERERALAAIVRESARAARLVDDLLTVSRLDDGIALRPEPVDLAELARHEIDRYRLLSPDLRWEGPGGRAVAVTADPVRLGQVVSNLLDNARHATPAGGTVTVTARRTDDGALLEVRDTGPGVPPEDRERIFDRLVRLDSSRSRTSGGAGLGLPIARAIARAHHGDLRVGDGAAGGCFRLTLPDAAPRPGLPGR